jgi:hypothetical protein
MTISKPGSNQTFDPGGVGPPRRLVRICDSTYSLISTAEEEETEETSRTDLDTHANMPVVGRNVYILSDTGETALVAPYSPDYEPKELRIVKAAALYSCPYTGQEVVLIIQQALHVPSMRNNLIPPFIMRECGIQVRDTPKIQVQDPSEDDHAIFFPETGFCIPLQLHGIFSYFPTRKPTTKELNELEEVYIMTPDQFNPHESAYSLNEAAMLDWEGNIMTPRQGKQVFLSAIGEDEELAMSCVISCEENDAIDRCLNEMVSEEIKEPEHPMLLDVPRAADEVGTVLSSVSPVFDDALMYRYFVDKLEEGMMKMSIGSTDASTEEFLIRNNETSDPSLGFDEHNTQDDNTDNVDSESISSYDAQVLLEEADKTSGLTNESLDSYLDDFMASAAHASPSRGGVTSEHLSKVWRIDLETAERTMEITSQIGRRKDDPNLSRNYATNDRMLRYRRIQDYFFMDTFFATKNHGKSSRGHTCCQLFVTDKGFLYVVPMRSKSEVMQAVKQFAKDVGAPDAIISDAAREQTSMNLRKFLGSIGTTLRVLEEGTPWANKAELYIGLIKEAVRKDMKDSNCPLPFWDYCVERRARINNLTAKRNFKLHGSNAYTETFGETGDISNLCQYQFYQWCYSREKSAPFPHNQEVLGRVLGPARGEGNEMAQWILKANGRVVPRRSHRPLTIDEEHSEHERQKRQLFDRLIERRWGTSISGPAIKSDDDAAVNDNELDEFQTEEEMARVIPDIEDVVDATGRLLNQNPAYDRLLNAEILFQCRVVRE